MNPKTLRLVNILEDKFDAPERTDGKNILFPFHQIVCEIKLIWDPDDTTEKEPLWEEAHLIDALEYLKFDQINKMNGEKAYLFVKK